MLALDSLKTLCYALIYAHLKYIISKNTNITNLLGICQMQYYKKY